MQLSIKESSATVKLATPGLVCFSADHPDASFVAAFKKMTDKFVFKGAVTTCKIKKCIKLRWSKHDNRRPCTF